MTYRTWESRADVLILRAVRGQRHRRYGPRLHTLLCLRGTDIAPQAELGEGLILKHGGIGVVIHPKVRIGRNVTIFHGVTIGRSDMWRDEDNFGGFEIGDDVILSAGAVLLHSGPQPLVIADGTVVGANAVLSKPTGRGEIWAGVPARKVADRDGY